MSPQPQDVVYKRNESKERLKPDEFHSSGVPKSQQMGSNVKHVDARWGFFLTPYFTGAEVNGDYREGEMGVFMVCKCECRQAPR